MSRIPEQSAEAQGRVSFLISEMMRLNTDVFR